MSEATKQVGHTPGPWTIDARYADQPVQEVYAANGSIVAAVYSGGVIDHTPDRPNQIAATRANTALILAAPALLAACEAVERQHESGGGPCLPQRIREKVRAAIAAARAEGGGAYGGACGQSREGLICPANNRRKRAGKRARHETQ